MELKHSREQARSAKVQAVGRFGDDDEVTSVGLGVTEDHSDYAVTITVSSGTALRRLPKQIDGVPVLACVTSESSLY